MISRALNFVQEEPPLDCATSLQSFEIQKRFYCNIAAHMMMKLSNPYFYNILAGALGVYLQGHYFRF